MIFIKQLISLIKLSNSHYLKLWNIVDSKLKKIDEKLPSIANISQNDEDKLFNGSNKSISKVRFIC